jgi:hypothetical protein
MPGAGQIVHPLPRGTWLLLLLAAAAFAPGLQGPFVLDDHVNLAPVWRWLMGQQDFWSTAFDNRSGPGGRPLAYLSFMANASVGADATFGYKAVNLFLHLANTALVAMLVQRLLALAGKRAWPPHAAVAIAALWAVHPMQASTVLYVVQRMALLGAFAQLAAVLAYLEARKQLPTDRAQARLLMFLVLPVVVLLGFAGKETALVAPLLCALVELCFFAGAPRPREVKLFFGLFLLLPAVAALALLAIDPSRIPRGYAAREFGLGDRLATEPRILLEYAGRWLFPAKLALYRDGHPVVSTLGAAWPGLVGVGGALLAALFALRRAPLVAFGVLWFLAGHALEAGPLGLELYFEHRNYLPGLGLALVLFALLVPALGRRSVPVAGAVACVFLLLSMVRSHGWGDIDRLLAGEAPPAGEVSRRLQVDRAIRAFETGDVAARRDALAVLAQGNAGNRAAAAAWTAVFACDADKSVSVAQLDRLQREAPSVVTHNHASWLSLLAARAAGNRCPGLTAPAMLAVLDAWEAQAAKPLGGHARRQFALMRQQLQTPR